LFRFIPNFSKFRLPIQRRYVARSDVMT